MLMQYPVSRYSNSMEKRKLLPTDARIFLSTLSKGYPIDHLSHEPNTRLKNPVTTPEGSLKQKRQVKLPSQPT